MPEIIKTRIRYRRVRVTVQIMKPDRCEACGTPGRLECHHYLYKYTTREVRKHPQLATENTIWLDYPCHKFADMLRNLASDRIRSQAVTKALMKKFAGTTSK